MHTEAEQLEKKVALVLDKYQHDKGMLVSILQDIQEEYNYLPRESLKQVSKTLDVPFSQLYSIATFFKALRLTPRGRHLINVCLGTACHVRGAVKVLEAMERELGIKSGGTTDGLEFTLETVNCVGACALGPVVIVDGEYHGQMKTEKVKDMLKEYS
jgi:NADH-quinone oxidoreductase subunit E